VLSAIEEMVRLDREISNRLFDILAGWNAALESLHPAIVRIGASAGENTTAMPRENGIGHDAVNFPLRMGDRNL
jgi:hypothetical protein